MQVPAQPLLHPPPFVDEIVAVVDEQLQLPKRLLIRARPAGSNPARAAPPSRQQARRSDRTCRVPCPHDAPAPSASAAPAPTLRRMRPALVPATASAAAVLKRPHRSSPSALAHASSSPFAATTVLSPSIRRPRRRRQPSPSACARPLRSRSCRSPPPTAAGDRRADRPHSRQLPSSYQVTSGGLGRRRRHNAGKSALGRRHAGIESAAAARVSATHRTPPRRRE
jgi:hypothetical protein